MLLERMIIESNGNFAYELLWKDIAFWEPSFLAVVFVAAAVAAGVVVAVADVVAAELPQVLLANA